MILLPGIRVVNAPSTAALPTYYPCHDLVDGEAQPARRLVVEGSGTHRSATTLCR